MSVLLANELWFVPALPNSFQCEHPNPVEKRYNHSGVFGSKFVTAVVTGNQEEMVDTLAFQATDQAMSLTRGWFLVAHMTIFSSQVLSGAGLDERALDGLLTLRICSGKLTYSDLLRKPIIFAP
jgi:hypothetical protein